MARRNNASDEPQNGREESSSVGRATIVGAVLGAVAVGAAWLISTLVENSTAPKLSSPQRDTANPRQSSFDATRNHPAENGDENITCVICMTNKANCLLQPCGHMKMCCQCSDKVSVCPLCRVNISEKIGPVFL